MELLTAVDIIVSIPLGLLAALVACVSFVLFRRVYLTNMCAFPGFWWSRATDICELYYDLYKDGQFSHMIAEMHARFGKVIRIGPTTLHIADPIYYKSLLADYSTFTWPRYPSPHATFSPDDLTRFPAKMAENRKVSLTKLAAVGTVISAKLAEFCDTLEEAQVAEHDIRMNMMFFNLAAGIVKACYLKPSSSTSPLTNTTDLERGAAVTTEDAVSRRLSLLKSYFDRATARIRTWMSAFQSEAKSNDTGILKELFQNVENPPLRIESWTSTCFRFTLNTKSFNDHRPRAYKLMRHSTVALDMSLRLSRALAVLFQNLLTNNDRLSFLRAELMRVMPQRGTLPAVTDLVAQPYLSACIREALRLSGAMDNCVLRTATQGPWDYADGRIVWRVPAGTAIRVSAKFVFNDAAVFPDPRSFRPERFLTDPAVCMFFDPFTAGMEVTWAAMFLTVAALFRSYSTVHAPLTSCLGCFEMGVNPLEPDREIYGYGGIPLVGPDEALLRYRIVPRRTRGQARRSLSISEMQ